MALRHWWKLDEPNAADVAVDSVGGCDLTPSSGAEPTVTADARFGYVREWGNTAGTQMILAASGASGSSGGNGTVEQVTPSAHPLAISFHTATEWSLAWWAAITGNITSNAGLFYLGKPDNQSCTHTPPATVHPSGHPHSVRIGHLNVYFDTSEIGTGRWSYAAGSQFSLHNGSNAYPRFSVWMHHALVRRGAVLEWWCNGTLINSGNITNDPYTPQDNYDDPNFVPGPEVFWIGSCQNASSTLNSFYNASFVKMAQVRIYDHALTEAEIIGLAAPSTEEPDTTAPVVTLISPANGTPIAKTGSIVVEIEDADLQRYPLWVKWPNEERRPWEVVHDGGGWGPGYEDSTISVVDSTTIRVTITRAKGWPSMPELNTRPYDTSGNEAS